MFSFLLSLALSVSISSEILVWANYSSSNWDIYLQKDGGKVVRLTKSGADELYPRISPDGQWIYFIKKIDGRHFIRRMSLSGVEDKFKISVSGAHFSLIGKKMILFERELEKRDAIWWKNIDTGKEYPAKVSVAKGLKGSPMYNPDVTFDGKTFFFLTKRWIGWGVAKYSAVDGNVSEVGKGCAPSISPDGRIAAYVSSNGNGGASIRAHNIATGAGSKLVDLPGDISLEYDPKFSNDGKWLIFCATKNGQRYVERGADYKIFKYLLGSGKPPELVIDLPGADKFPDLYIGD